MAVLKNVTAYWCKTGKPEKKYASEETQWSVKLVVEPKISKAWVKKGFAQKEKTMEVDGKEHRMIQITKNTHRKDGKEVDPPLVVDKYGRELDPDSVGNGSVVDVQYRIFEWDMAGRSGLKPILEAVRVVDHVERAGTAQGSEFDYDEMPEDEEVDLGGDDDLDLDLDDEFE